MGTHFGELGVVEPPRLGEDVGADVDLADVVQGRAEPEILERRLSPAEPACHRLGVEADARSMALE